MENLSNKELLTLIGETLNSVHTLIQIFDPTPSNLRTDKKMLDEAQEAIDALENRLDDPMLKTVCAVFYDRLDHSFCKPKSRSREGMPSTEEISLASEIFESMATKID